MSQSAELSPNSRVTPSGALHLYRQMLIVRRFEEAVHEAFMQNLVRGTVHLGIGQEAVAIGFAAALQPTDYTLATYRGHAHALARGASLTAGFAELFGRSSGLCKGKGGSMHFTDVQHGVMGSYAIVGAHLPIACGVAWSSKIRGTDAVTTCFFGDGATNIGAFHEALNLAVVWSLPVLFVCENNLYMEYTPISSVTAVGRPAADRAPAYGLEPITVDGNDVDAVYAVAREGVARARSGKGPCLIEALTYRHSGHSRTDPGRYRPAGELESWKERDPISLYRTRLEASGHSAQTLAVLEREVDEEVDATYKEALAAPAPTARELFTDVFCEGETTWRN